MIIWRSNSHTGKTWRLDATLRQPTAEKPLNPHWWRVDSVARFDESRSIEDVLLLLRRLEQDPCLKIQMGRLTDSAIAALERGESIRRRAHPPSDPNGPPGTTLDHLEALLVVDVDSVPWPDGFTLDDGEEAIKALVNQRAPQPLQCVDFVYQHTGSAGFAGPARASLRLFFLCTPTTQAEIGERLSSGAIRDEFDLLDRNLYSRNQSIITAPPRLLDGIIDPITSRGLSRSGLIVGDRRRVELPHIVHARQERLVEQPCVTDCSPGLARRQLEKHINALECLGPGGGRWDAARRAAKYLGGHIANGLDEEDVVRRLVAACERNGCIGPKRTRASMEQTIRSAVVAGKQQPIIMEFRGTDSARGRRARALEASTDEAPNPKTYSAARPPSSKDEREAAVRDALSAALMGCAPDKLVMLRVAAGAGKSHALTSLALSRGGADAAAQAFLDWRGRGGVVLAFKTYALLAEAEDRLRAGGLEESANIMGPAYQVIRGRLRRCARWVGDDLHDEAERQARRHEIEVADEAHELALICSRCPHRHTCPLVVGRGSYPPLAGRISLMTHAMLPHLARYTRDGDEAPLVLIDEAPPTLYETTATLDALRCFDHEDADTDCVLDADAAWRRSEREVADLVKELRVLIEERVEAAARRAPKRRCADLQEALDGLDSERLKALRSLAERVRTLDLAPPTNDDEKLNLERLKRLAKNDPLLVTRHKLSVLATLVAALLDDAPMPVLLMRDEDGRVGVHSWQRFRLPAGAPVLIADATPDDARWALIAKADGRTLQRERAELVAHPLRLLVWRTKRLSRSSLFDRHGGIERAAVETLNALGCALLGFLGSTQEPVAVGCHYRQLALLLQDALDANGDEDGDEDRAHDQLREHNLVRLLGARPVEVGYTGADGVGSNRFEESAVLLLLSDPWAHLVKHEHEERAIAALTGHAPPSQEEIAIAYQDAALRTLVQWVGRLRHQRAANKRAVVAGGLDPEVIANAILEAFRCELVVEVIAQPERLDADGGARGRGGRDSDPNTDEAREAVRSLLLHGQSLTPREVCELLLRDPTESYMRSARRLLAEVRKEVGMMLEQEDGGLARGGVIVGGDTEHLLGGQNRYYNI